MDLDNNNFQQTTSNQEIDLLFLFKKLKGLFTGFCLSVFRVIQFLFRYKIVLLILLVLGISLGYAFDKFLPKKYKTEILIIPNFNSTEYLYSEIENISSNYLIKRRENKLLEDLTSIKLAPVIDVKSFLNNYENKEFLKLLSENGQNFEDFIKDKSISKINKFHLITITTNSEKNTEKIVKLILEDLNHSDYFNQRKQIESKNLEFKKNQLIKSIDQINSILDKLGSEDRFSQKNDVSINTYDQMNSIIDLKKIYVDELATIEMKLVEFNQVIYPVNISYNNNPSNKFYLKGIFIFPILLIFGFIGFKSFQHFYHKYDQISQARNGNKIS